jgi:hypothetical protein
VVLVEVQAVVLIRVMDQALVTQVKEILEAMAEMEMLFGMVVEEVAQVLLV